MYGPTFPAELKNNLALLKYPGQGISFLFKFEDEMLVEPVNSQIPNVLTKIYVEPIDKEKES